MGNCLVIFMLGYEKYQFRAGKERSLCHIYHLRLCRKLPVEKHLLLPKENRYHTNVFSYLTGRGIDNDIGVTVSEAVISTDMVSRHIKRQEKEYDSLILNPLYTIPKNRLDF